MQRHNFIILPCQYCGKAERRVIWREGNAVTCFACKLLRRNERAKLKRRKLTSTATLALPSGP